LTSLLTDGSGTTELSDNVTTTGAQTYNDDVDLKGDVIAESTGGSDITFARTVDGAHNLTVNTTGSTMFRGNVGPDTSLTTLMTDAGGTTHVSGNVTTTSGITFGDNVTADGISSLLKQRIDAGAGTLDADGNIKKTTAGNLTLAGGNGIVLGGNVRGIPGTGGFRAEDTITFENNVTADGGDQWFDAGVGTLWAQGKITKTGTGDLHLGGDEAVDLDDDVDIQTDGGSLFIEDDFTAEGDLLASKDVIFAGSVVNAILDGSGNQLIDARAGTLTASGTITKTDTGNLTLSGGILVNLDGKVQVGYGDLLITDTVDAEELLQAGGLVHLQGSSNNLADDVTGNGITFNSAVTADGGAPQSFDATTGTLLASNTITKTTSGNLTLGGDTDIELHGTVEVQDGSLFIEDDFHASADLLASQDITFAGSAVNGELDGIGDQRIDAQTGTLTANGWLHKGDGSLYLEAAGDISLADYVEADSGGVSIISENGKIFTPGGLNDTLNVPITGSSNDNINGSTGVTLRDGGKGAVVIISKDGLKLGANSTLIAGGTYYPDSVDDRSAIYFRYDGEHKGERIDVAVYIASMDSDVYIGSQGVQVASGGTMVADAYDAVVFEDGFVNTISSLEWLEACSRITTSLGEAASQGTLPYADDPETMQDFLEDSYVLRGDSFVEALVLYGDIEEQDTIPKRTPMEAEASATSMPASPEISDIGQIESTVSGDLQWLGEELGLCEGDQQGEDDNRCQEITQAYLAGAFLQASDMRPQQAAAQLRQLAGLLHDTDGSRIAALGRVINEFAQPDVPPSPEQFASIGQAFAIHVNDGTHYSTAKEWLDALAEYTMLLISEIGWSSDDSVAFVMSKYGPTVTETSDVGIVAFIQMHLEDISG
ncbi:MAG TPA: hypothetical protein VMW72_22015, partial [Sedimentisphaerales bacterium]|nr:hypothetical protein [Sedimentisphaerales bacterium]